MARHRLSRLPLGADKQHAPATGDHIANSDQRLMQQRNRLGKINYVNTIALTENERSHFGIPAMGLVTKVYACFK